MNDKKPDAEGDELPGRPEPPAPGLESGTYESDAGSEHVWVRRVRTGETVRARVEGYPPDFRFEHGDETGIEMVDGVWHALPSIVRTVTLRTRVEWWITNSRTGQLRFLTARDLDTDPAGGGNRAQQQEGP